MMNDCLMIIAAKRKQKAREERELKQQQITSGAPSASSTPATAAAAASSSDNGVLEVVDTGHGVRRSGAGDDGTDEPAKPLGISSLLSMMHACIDPFMNYISLIKYRP